MISDLEIVVRILAAFVLGGIIGYERQSRHKSAGLRTHILVCVGASLIMTISINIYSTVQGLTNADPARLAAQVVSGIGFLGAGSIITSKGSIIGLTTAASLWVVAGVGLAAGCANYVGAVTTTLIVFLTLRILSKLDKHIVGNDCNIELVVVTVDKPGQVGRIGSCIGERGVGIQDIRMESEDVTNRQIDFAVCLKVPPHIKIGRIISDLMDINGIISVSIR